MDGNAVNDYFGIEGCMARDEAGEDSEVVVCNLHHGSDGV